MTKPHASVPFVLSTSFWFWLLSIVSMGVSLQFERDAETKKEQNKTLTTRTTTSICHAFSGSHIKYPKTLIYAL